MRQRGSNAGMVLKQNQEAPELSDEDERKAFEKYATSAGLMRLSHGILAVNHMCDAIWEG